MSRSRSEYRLMDLPGLAAGSTLKSAQDVNVRAPLASDRDGLAALMLDAYGGTIDDEGEGIDEALEAVDHYVNSLEPRWSVVAERGGVLVGMCFVATVEGRYYIDPIAVGAESKTTGIGRSLVRGVLATMSDAGVDEVGAVITDGNTASEKLFRGLGFDRLGPWG